MKINDTMNGGLKFYVSILPALFPAIVMVFLAAGLNAPRSKPAKLPVQLLADKVRQIYTSQIGVREKPSNSGPQVEKYLRYAGLSKGNPWCAAFVCWTFGEANVENPRSGWSPALFGERYVIWGKGAESGKLKACLAGSRGESVHRYAYSPQVLHPGESIRLIYAPTQTSDFRPPTSDTRRSASTPSLVTGNWQLTTDPQAGKTPPSNPPTPTTGDVFGLYFPEKGRIAHVGFVDDWTDSWMISVEGNTNVAGSREGDGVYRKRRLVASIYKVARYVEARHSNIKGK